MKRKLETITINNFDLQDIKKGEKKKSRLENQGFNLIKTVCLISRTQMFYEKILEA